MILTLNQVIKVFNDFADGHDQINDFGYGSPSDISTSKQTSYPLLWMTSTTGTSYQATNKTLTPTHNFAFIIADVWNNQPNFNDVNGYNSSNVQEVMSDMELIARDLITFIQVNVQQLGLGISVEDNITIDPLEDESPDKIFGWVINCTLKLKHLNCEIPGDFDNINPFEPCPDATVTNSDASFTQDIEPGRTLTLSDINVTINGVDQGDFPSVQDLALTYECPVSEANSLPPLKTGQTTSYATNDDGDLERGRDTDFTTLSWLNPFGDNNRFTDELGGQTFTNQIYIDWTSYKESAGTVLAYAIGQQQNVLGQANMGAKLWASWMSGQPYTLHSFSGWYVANFREMIAIANIQDNTGASSYLINYAPFNYTISSGFFGLYTSSTYARSSGLAWALWLNSAISVITKTTFNSSALLVREFTLAELGL